MIFHIVLHKRDSILSSEIERLLEHKYVSAHENTFRT